MKRLFSCLALAATLAASAQTIHVWQGGTATNCPMTQMTYSNQGRTLNIGGTAYQTSAIDSLTFTAVERVVTVCYQGATAQVSIPAAYAGDVTASVSGAHVSLTNTDTANEFEVRVSGTTTNGSLTYNGTFKATIALDNANITNPAGAALNIQCGKRIALTLKGDNALTDGPGDQKACLYCKGHLEVSGSGNLTVSGNQKHAISTKEYLQLKRSCGNITIAKAVGDAIHAGQYFQMNGGNLTIDQQTLGDGVQVETTTDLTDEHNGEIIVKGGTLNITITSQDCKAMKCDGLITISGGTFNLAAKSNGSRGIQTDGDMVIGEEDGTTNITVSAEGGKCTLAECAADPHRCMGIKVDGTLTVNAGTVKVTNTGEKSRGIKCGVYKKNGGTVSATIVN